MAEAEQPWTHSTISPVTWLGLTGAESTEQLGGVNAFARWALQSDDPLPAVQIMPVETLSPDRLQELLAQLTAPDRSEGLLITTVEQGGALTGAMLVARTMVLWPGLASLVMVTEDGRRVLTQHLPQQPVPQRGARWFAPSTDSITDQTLRAGHLTRPSTLAKLVDRALKVRTETAPVGLAADAAVLLTSGGSPPVPTLPDQIQVLRDRNATLAKELVETRRLLDERSAQLSLQERQLAAERDRGDRLERDLTSARDDLHQRDVVIEDLTRQLGAAHAEADRYAAAAEKADEELADAVRARGELARLLARSETRQDLEVCTLTEPVPNDFGALIDAASHRFSLLVFDTVDVDVSRTLDEHQQAGAWRRRTWNALSTLQSYAHARQAGDTVGDLLTYSRSGAPGVLISASTIATGEHERVKFGERFRRARTFRVAPDTDPRGEAFFGAHIRLGSGRPPAPRLHFLDDTGRTGRIYVGYIGPHLPNQRTN
ncbi:hypothetical protein ACFY4C_41490 [Actinomadura viridis]|uniref:hypothetical protein n=1 Tax=Actinomadura viridis TaxID=58110 RepID=UPI0036CE63BB